jgi:hypothetical protein
MASLHQGPKDTSNFDATYFLGNFVIKGYSFLCRYNQKKNLTESIKKIIGYHLKNKSCPLPMNR